MRRSRRPIIIASRRSALARVQAEAVGAALKHLHPKVDIEFRWIESEGDQRIDAALADAGGKGLFAKAVEEALLRNEADLAVHSLKDLPTKLTKGLTIAAVPKREDPRDCFISHNGEKTIDDLVGGAIVGTASPRRSAQLLRLRPDLKIQLLRGNVQTRLRKVTEPPVPGEAPAYAATVMAVAGLLRAGLGEHVKHILDTDLMLPAAGQGALALQCRGDDHITIRRVLPLNDPAASEATDMERKIIHGLHGDCRSPIAALAEPIRLAGRPGMRLRARVLSPTGHRCADATHEAAGKNTRHLPKRVLEDLLKADAEDMLKEG